MQFRNDRNKQANSHKKYDNDHHAVIINKKNIKATRTRLLALLHIKPESCGNFDFRKFSHLLSNRAQLAVHYAYSARIMFAKWVGIVYNGGSIRLAFVLVKLKECSALS